MLSKIRIVRFLYRVVRLVTLLSTKLTLKKFPLIDGLPYPWLTRPCVDYLENIDFEGKYVLEFGSSFSTAYFDRRGAKVISYEREEDWVERLKTMVSVNCDVRHFKDKTYEGSDEYINKTYELLRKDKCFDVLVVDVFQVQRL